MMNDQIRRIRAASVKGLLIIALLFSLDSLSGFSTPCTSNQKPETTTELVGSPPLAKRTIGFAWAASDQQFHSQAYSWSACCIAFQKFHSYRDRLKLIVQRKLVCTFPNPGWFCIVKYTSSFDSDHHAYLG